MLSAERPSVLLLSCGRRVELVRALKAALARRIPTGRLIGVDANPLAPALRFVDRAYRTVPMSDPRYLESLPRLIEREHVGLVLPLIDPDITWLAAHRALIESAGALPYSVEAEAAATCEDKWATTAFFRKLGLAVPHTSTVEEALKESQWPLFVKPRRGSASKHAYLAGSARQLESLASLVPDPMVQAVVAGPEITMDVVTAPDGRLLGWAARQRLEVRGGEVSKGVTIAAPDLLVACRQIAAALPARGPVTVQCLMDGQTPRFTEINARLGGGIPLAINAGVDVAGLLLEAAMGVPAGSIQIARPGVYVARYDEAVFLEQRDLDEVPPLVV